MADEPEDPNVHRDELFHLVRDGDYVDAKKALAKADMAWRHTALQQNFLFFIAARRRRGSELLARQCIEMGVNLEEVDVHGQTPLFWAAARGNLVIVKFLLNLGFEVNFRDKARKSALFLAIENGHLAVADFLIEHAASTRLQSSEGRTPQSMLKALHHKAPTNKRKWVTPTPACVCPGAATRSRFCEWEWAGAQEESDPLIEKSEDNVLVENHQYYVCASVTGCSKRLRRSEREFVGDHAHLHQQETWYSKLTPENSATLVNVSMGDEKAHEKIIDELAQGSRPRAFTLAAVSQQTRTLAGYVYASFTDETLKIGQVKVDRPHQERGLGGLLLKAAEKRAQNLGASIAKVQLTDTEMTGLLGLDDMRDLLHQIYTVLSEAEVNADNLISYVSFVPRAG
ncbi:ANKRD65 [Symbiodinium sp. CCMP2592]|nr:ANKRD65 [Symbiodinium sp. CCMP2592]